MLGIVYMNPYKTIHQYGSDIVYCHSMFELNKIAEELRQSRFGPDDKAALRIVWKDRRQYLQRRAACAPHNNPRFYEERGEHVYCTECNGYIGRPVPLKTKQGEKL